MQFRISSSESGYEHPSDLQRIEFIWNFPSFSCCRIIYPAQTLQNRWLFEQLIVMPSETRTIYKQVGH